MKFCPFCGSKLLPNAKFCGSCGRTIPQTSEPRKEGCYICGKQELLPFTCRYCQRVFCASHRLPENHQCIGISHQKDAPWTMQGRKATSARGTTPQYYTFRYETDSTYPGRARRSSDFSPPPGMDIVTFGSEMRDLLVGTLLIAFFVFSIFLSFEGISVTSLFLAIIGALLASCTA
ncbi:MAG: AN1-type zinc finger domain-containing protein, partial [Candidatus Hodarchaeales archaeon]